MKTNTEIAEGIKDMADQAIKLLDSLAMSRSDSDRELGRKLKSLCGQMHHEADRIKD